MSTREEAVTLVVMAAILGILLTFCVSLLPNAVDQALGIGDYSKDNCVSCHDGERECYFEEN